MSFLNKILGDPNKKVVSQIQPIVDAVNALEDDMASLSLEQLKEKTVEFRARLEQGETLDNILPEAFAVVREASKRVNKMRHYDVQLVGGVVLHRGQIAEMGTGEGKTLVATLPVYLNALADKGVHVVTVNDYLAKRDAIWMGKIYTALGLEVGIIQNMGVSFKFVNDKKVITDDASNGDDSAFNEKVYKVEDDYIEDCSRADVYKCDIVYGTNNEFGFDYLRDNMVQNIEDKVQRPFYYAIVDEIDSILIDEARTPLIISSPAEDANEMYFRFAELVRRLKENEDYNIEEKHRVASLSEVGISKMEKWLGIENIYAEGGIRTVHHVEQALRAHALFHRDKDYIVEGEEIIIVDEFTGRKMEGRRYSEGLHQAIEAKERVKVQQESQTMATVTFQNYFRMYEKLSGMTGTAVTEAEEFGKIYSLEVVVIPPNQPSMRDDRADKIYKTEKAKFTAIAQYAKELQKSGQPVLIGTASVEKNELLSEYLSLNGVEHEILNAKNHEREGEIVAQAGKPGRVTLATNMAGRGVDIVLGGNPPDKDEQKKILEGGGLHVIGTERHESRRIDNQLRGRAGRQGDPGVTQFYLSTEDDLMRIFAGDRIKSVMNTLKVPDDMPIEQRSISKVIESAQKKVEGMNFDTRKHLLDYDDVLNRHREVIYGKRDDILNSFRDLREDKEVAKDKTLRSMVEQMIEDEIESVVSFNTNSEEQEKWNIKEIIETVVTIYPLTDREKDKIYKIIEVDDGAQKDDDVQVRTDLIEYLVLLSKEKYIELLEKPIDDPKVLIEIEKQVLLRAIDNLWVDHLVNIDFLRTGIGLRGYAQQDPLVEYKKETYRMFNELLSSIQQEVVYLIFKVNIGIKLAPSVMQAGNMILQGAVKKSNGEKTITNKKKDRNSDGSNVGRNDPCPCGSGQKFKKCCG